MASLKDGCTQSIYKYAPAFRQANAALTGEHEWFVKKVIRHYRSHYQSLKDVGETEWVDLPQEWLDEYFSDKPY